MKPKCTTKPFGNDTTFATLPLESKTQSNAQFAKYNKKTSDSSLNANAPSNAQLAKYNQ